MATTILTSLDMSHNEILNQVLHVLGSAPGSPVTGQIYYDSGLGELGYYTGSAWVYPGSGGGGGTVTTVSVATANGFQGTVANATSTPAITLQTSVTSGSVLKSSSNSIVAAVSATDYAPATTGTSILKASSGGFANAVSGTDYAPATSGTSILKGNGSGGFNNAVSGTDYPPIASPTFTGTPAAPTASAGTNTTQIATTAFVTTAVQATQAGLNIKNSAVAAGVGTETYTISSGNVTQITGTTFDGVSPAVDDYVLIKDAPAATGTGSVLSTEPGNGLYQVTGNTTNLSVSRATDMSGTNVPNGAFVFVEGGTVNASSGWVVSVPATDAAWSAYGTSSIKWTQFSGAGEITAGSGLSKSGNTLSISAPVSVANGGTNATSIAAAKTSLGFASIYNSGTIGDGSSTTLTVTHNLNNSYPNVEVWSVTNSAVVVCDIATTSVNAITLTFAAAPASNSIACTVIG
jgi:hypothetical protein